jgi:hypothetical protein
MDKPRKSKKGKKSKKRAAAGLPASVKGLLRYMEGSQAPISRTPRSTPQAGAGAREAANIKIKLNIGSLPQQQVASALASATAPLVAARQQAAQPAAAAATAEVKSIARQLGEETLARQKLELGVQREVFGVEQKLAQQATTLRKEFNEEALKFLQPERQLPRITLPQSDAPAIGEEVVKIKRARRSRPVEVKEERIEVAVEAPPTETEQQQQQQQYEKFMPGQFLGIGASGEMAPPMSVGLEKYKQNAPTGEIVLKDKPKKQNKMPKKVPLFRVEEQAGGFVSSTEQTVRQDLASRVAGMKQKLMSAKATKPNPNIGSASAGSFSEIIEQQKAASAKQQPLFSAASTAFAAGAGSTTPTRSPFSVKETGKLFAQLTGGAAPKFRTTGAGSRKTVQAFSQKLNTLSKTGANAQQIKELMAEFPTAFEGSVQSE